MWIHYCVKLIPHLNNIFSSMSRSLKWPLAFMLSDWSSVAIWNQYHASYVPHPADPHGFWWWNKLYLSCYKICISNKCTSGTMRNFIKLKWTLFITDILDIINWLFSSFKTFQRQLCLHPCIKCPFNWAQSIQQVLISNGFLPVDGGTFHSLKHCLNKKKRELY